jgi:hypothetical protein
MSKNSFDSIEIFFAMRIFLAHPATAIGRRRRRQGHPSKEVKSVLYGITTCCAHKMATKEQNLL